ncbi:MAG TPA: hypothetical protein VKX41_05325 [Alloacidobacterium sp.]|jgi:hypothetical protein|nr:hypothetical protein [Alloacidobacterium sp.]
MTFARTLLLSAAALLLVTGCETGRTNKAHATWQHLSDETTTGKPEMAKAAPATGQPPVPGSPTASGPDGLQPLNDSEARQSVGTEEGSATPPREQKKDPFQRQ